MAFRLVVDRNTISTFVKTDSPQIIEILGLCGLDYIILDAEHAPFDRRTTDRMIFAAGAVKLPVFVRIPDHLDATILSVLDMGADGIVVPHVDSAEHARNVVAASRFIHGRRGISLSARFARYGTQPRDEAIAEADRSVVVCQIESGAAVEAVEDIAAVPGIGGLLIGRSDLALSLGLDSPRHPIVLAAVTRIVEAARRHSVPVVVVCGNDAEVLEFSSVGAHSFVFGSDQSLLRSAASRLSGLLPSTAS